MNAQQMFDHVADHLATQQVQSAFVNERGTLHCRYRHYGLKCAVGALIPDELYEKTLEGRGIERLIQAAEARAHTPLDEPIYAFLRDTFKPNLRSLAIQLQNVHDLVLAEDANLQATWAEGLRALSSNFNVVFDEERFNRIWSENECRS